MNIIANTCIGARLYQLNNCEYTNPFMWSIVSADDMIKLIENYDKINFKNFIIEKSDYYNRTEFYKKQFINELKQPYFIFKIKIDNLIDVHYVHYMFNSNYENKTVVDVNVFWNKIWEYVVEKYKNRVEKMMSFNENPKFVITAFETDYTIEKQQKLLDIKTNHKIILITDNPEQLNAEKPNVLVKKAIRPIGTCIKLAETYNTDVLSF